MSSSDDDEYDMPLPTPGAEEDYDAPLPPPPATAPTESKADFYNPNASILKSGWMRKVGGRVKNVKTRWFVLEASETPEGSPTLKYYENVESYDSKGEPLGCITLNDKAFCIHNIKNDNGDDSDSDDESTNMSGKPTTTQISRLGRLRNKKAVPAKKANKGEPGSNLDELSFEIGVPGRIYILKCDTQALLKSWVQAVEDTIASQRKNLAGYLTKQGFSRPTWKLRWFTLDEDQKKLFYYKSPSDTTTPLGFVPLENCDVKEVEGKINVAHSFVICTPHRNYYQFATDRNAARRWISGIRKSIPKYTSINIPFLRTNMRYGGNDGKTFNDVYLELKRRYLFIYLSHKEIQHFVAIDLNGSSVRQIPPNLKNSQCCFCITTSDSTEHYLAADSRADQKFFITTLEKAQAELVAFESGISTGSFSSAVDAEHGFESDSARSRAKRASKAYGGSAAMNMGKIAKSSAFRASIMGMKPVNPPE